MPKVNKGKLKVLNPENVVKHPEKYDDEVKVALIEEIQGNALNEIAKLTGEAKDLINGAVRRKEEKELRDAREKIEKL